MKKLKLILLYFLLFCSAVASSNACRTEKIDRNITLKTIKLYSKVMDYLEQNNVKMAFVGRKGLQNKYVEYTHMGVIWKDGDDWKVTDLLQLCEEKKPELFDEGVGEFLMSSKVSTVKLLVPSGETQDGMIEILKNKEVDRFLGEKYNLISNVWETKYQNCTQYILEIYSYLKSGRQLTTREEAVNWYKNNGYKPERLVVSVFMRNIARLHKHVALDDRKNGANLEISTVDSNFEFIKKLESYSEVTEFVGE